MWIKICGIKRLEDAVAAYRFGADAIGFIFADSPRRVTPERAREISRCMPYGLSRVGVFVDSTPDEVRETAEYCGLDLVQLHGNEDEEYCESLGDGVIKALRVNEETDVLQAWGFGNRPLLLDGYCSGGNGAQKRYTCLLALLKPGREVIVAGGLDPGNVAKAVSTLRPWGVDVASGVELSPGVKDHALMYSFIERARKAEYEVNES
ncbi:MAG: phosphoribosylanthranilate isomerase [Actinobacteria bacterium]|nr:phosphoribosylanthranilate isomerase [Actinomycetota bacterium]MCG2819110.1 phosphoribosylanthranilate isomerase [Actinomycetes bacterium]MBU4179746.1 phosphoribosylanthranilate isomerase [Actinomycetota bacterium]MBU4218717.1 phosphoribosylanthranilate isomerase [Actinomycetota bacterium]MBU4359446.1 phosphoribosylanthranilate isomerase [Actinomycetota bacterium]